MRRSEQPHSVEAQPSIPRTAERGATAAGTAYQTGLTELGWYQGGEYVVTDELGIPVHKIALNTCGKV